MDDSVRVLVQAHWDLEGATLEPLLGSGVCSRTWHVSLGRDRWVAKAVPVIERGGGLGFERGLEVAELLAQLGFRTGCPRRTVAGHLVEPLGEWNVAVLQFEEGEPCSVADRNQATRVGEHIAKVHDALQQSDRAVPAWDPAAELLDQPYVALRPGLGEVATRVVESAVAAMADAAVGLIHGDLEEDEILVAAADESIAVVDWGSVQVAPLVLDLMSFHDREGFAALLEGYTSVRPQAEADLRALQELERLQWLRQTAFWGGRVLEPFDDAEQRQGFPNQQGFERSYEILITGRWRP